MNYSRIESLMDLERMQASCATIVGNGGGANLARNLVRCGLGHIRLVDFDTVEAVNICRQEHMHDMVGMRKVEALARELRRIDPELHVECFPHDLCAYTDAEIDRNFGDSDVFVFAVDNLPANARGNATALRLGIPAVWSGVYARGRAGEVVFWHPEIRSCHRCLCGSRYRAHAERRITTTPQDSPDVLSVQFIDSVAGMVVIGLLTRGAANFYGQLVDRLGDRNFLQMKIDPDWNWNGRDIFREQLGIAGNCNAYFSFVSIARRDPSGGEPPCPDCVKYRGRMPTTTESVLDNAVLQ